MRDYVETMEWLEKCGVPATDDAVREAMADRMAARMDAAKEARREPKDPSQ